MKCYSQYDAMDCGPTCLRIIASSYGKHYSLQSLRDRCHITRGGVSLLGISDAADSIGFRTTGVKLTWKQLRDQAKMPCIVHWNQDHFVVVDKISRKNGHWWVWVADPAVGELLKYNETQFRKSWIQSHDTLNKDNASEQGSRDSVSENNYCSDQGIALLLEPTAKFYQNNGNDDKKKHLLSLLHYMRPYKAYLVQLGLSMLTASVLGLILPFLTQSVVDIGIGLGDISFVVMILIAQVLLTLGQMASSLIRNWLTLHMTTRISISFISDFLAKLMRLPIAFFDSKMVGDIMQRIDDYDRIQSLLTGSLLSIAMAIVSFVIYGTVMASYNINILFVFIIGSAIYIGWVLMFMKRRRKLDYMRFQESAANQSNVVQLINGMQDIKLNNCEKQKRWEWERIQARLFKVSVKGLALGQAQDVGGTFIDQTKNVLISFLAASAVIDGNMTIGMMMAMQYVIGQLNAPLSQMIGFVQAVQDAKMSLERLQEIQNKEDEEPDGAEILREIPENADIEFRNVVFQYAGPHSPKVLNDVCLKIPHNKVTAIVGESGSGKTTMLKMMLGFYHPIVGEVLLGNRKLSIYSPSCWRSECGAVMQEGYIFSDTILNNIGVSSDVTDIRRVHQAAEIANIEEYITQLPLGYNTRIGADGNGLSTGQKQRLLIARAAYKNAKYLFFDEATNSLDANNERTIMERLNKLFANKTVVIVAHRLSTVKNADNIVVLANGQIVEQGTHTELAAKQGYYYELIKNQLELSH